MKITRIECFEVPPRWLFVKISTDEGICGWGEASVEGRTATSKSAVEELTDYLIGKDPLQIEGLWTTLYRGGFYRGGIILASAQSGIDQALWDIKGKWHNAPIHQLLGGLCRDKIKVYSWIGGDQPGDVGQTAKTAVAAGFTAVKMNGTNGLQIVDSYQEVDAAVARLAEVRAAVGPYIGIGVDFHGRVHKPMAPHCPLGPIALAACLQVDATAYNAFIQEQSLGIHYNQGADLLDYLKDPKVFEYSDGFVKMPTGPGLGIEVNEEYVREQAKIGHRWRNPVWRHADGSFAEW